MHRLVTIGALGIALAGLAAPPARAAAGDAVRATETSPSARVLAPPAAAGAQAVVLETTQGTIVIRLADAEAPKTSANYRKLVRQKFYDGTCFHRVIRGFMVQGGDPHSKDSDPSNDGAGGPGYTVAAEIRLEHVRGAVATARLPDGANPSRASSGSQFFIDLAALPSLDSGGYTVFGQVISGMDAVDKIAAFANDAALPAAAGGGRNPGRKARIIRATLEPLSKWQRPDVASVPDSAR